jgi:hypothetical protein
MQLPVFRGDVVLSAALCIFAVGCSTQFSSSSADPTPAATAFLTPSTLTFPNQKTGTTSKAQIMTLSNNGSAELTIASIEASGDFAETNNCGSSLPAGGRCTILVTFNPSVARTRNGTLSIDDHTNGLPDEASLVGTGAASQSVRTAGCTELPSKAFPSCFALDSPTALLAKSATKQAKAATRMAKGSNNNVQANFQAGFQTAFAADTTQIADLLDGSDPNPIKTIGALGTNALQGALSAPPPGFCFNPTLAYANHPEAAQSGFSATGQMLNAPGIWRATDSKGQACAAAELNLLMNAASGFTQLGLAMAAQMNYISGADLPTIAGGSNDETAAFNADLQQAGSQAGPFQSLQLVVVQFSGSSYIYTVKFTATDSSATYQGTIVLTQTPGGGEYSYSGVLQFELDDGTNLTAASVRYQRTSQTNLNLSARTTYFPTGYVPTPDPNGELDPTDPNWILSFSRFGASFDPTSSHLTGNYVYAFQSNAPGAPGPQSGEAWAFQVIHQPNGTGSAFYGQADSNTTIDKPTVWQIDHTTCLHMGTLDVHHLYAQFQPFEFDSGAGQYVPSSTVPAQIRFAPTSSCQWTDVQWNGGAAANSFWYDRPLQYTGSAPGHQPPTPSPVPQYVVANALSSNYAFSLFGDDQSNVQTLINAKGFIPPKLF